MCHTAKRPLLLRFHCFGAFEVRGGRLDSPANALSTANRNGPYGTRPITSPGAGHDGAGGTAAAAGGSDEDPLVESDSPALDCMHER